MLYLDIPSDVDLVALARKRHPISVSIFLPTTPVSTETRGDRIALKNLSKEALAQLEAKGADKRQLWPLTEALDALIEDDEFWRFQAHGLVIYATPDNLQTFRVPNVLVPMVEVSDRFHLKPLLRATTFGNACYVLALAEGGARLIEVSADLPANTVKVSDLPIDAAAAVGQMGALDRSEGDRLGGSDDIKLRQRKFVRQVDAALRGLLAGSNIPLVLASVDQIGALYRSVNSYAHLAAEGIQGNPEKLTDAELATAARPILDGLHREQLAEWTAQFHQRNQEGRATTDVAQAARAATLGAVQSLMVNMDVIEHGTVDDETGAVSFAESASADSYGVADEVARRVLLSGGQVLSVRQADIPDGKSLAAILRYAV